MNMNQLKKAAPDLLGSSFSSAAPNYAGILSQLRAIGMMPAAWAMEALMEANDGLQEQVDKFPSGEEVAELLDTLQKATDGFDALGDALSDREAELAALMVQHDDDEDPTLYLRLSDTSSALAEMRDTLTKLAQEVEGVKATIED